MQKIVVDSPITMLRPIVLWSAVLSLLMKLFSEVPIAVAFATSPLPASMVKHPKVAKRNTNNSRPDDIICVNGINHRSRCTSSLAMTQSHLHDVLSPPSPSLWPTVLASYDEAAARQEAFQDRVSFADLLSDPTLRIAFAASAVAVVVLFAAKAVVTQMDEAVERVALDFDRAMTLKYAEKWKKFMVSDGGDGQGDDGLLGAESEEDRIQRVVEEMERLNNEEPEFMKRVMRDIERMNT